MGCNGFLCWDVKVIEKVLVFYLWLKVQGIRYMNVNVFCVTDDLWILF